MSERRTEEKAYDIVIAMMKRKAELGALACRENGGTDRISETWTIPTPLTELDEDWPMRANFGEFPADNFWAAEPIPERDLPA